MQQLICFNMKTVGNAFLVRGCEKTMSRSRKVVQSPSLQPLTGRLHKKHSNTIHQAMKKGKKKTTVHIENSTAIYLSNC